MHGPDLGHARALQEDMHFVLTAPSRSRSRPVDETDITPRVDRFVVQWRVVRKAARPLEFNGEWSAERLKASFSMTNGPQKFSRTSFFNDEWSTEILKASFSMTSGPQRFSKPRFSMTRASTEPRANFFDHSSLKTNLFSYVDYSIELIFGINQPKTSQSLFELIDCAPHHDRCARAELLSSLNETSSLRIERLEVLFACKGGLAFLDGRRRNADHKLGPG